MPEDMLFKILDNKQFPCNDYGREPYLENWPMLYILEDTDEKHGYVGESNNVSRRMKNHQDNPEKEIFKKVHFIYSPQFNQSVTFDFESKLIQYIAADGKLKLTNRNKGLADINYFQKDDYDGKFRELWNHLKEKNIVKNSLDDIENSNLFKYSPYKELNDDQCESIRSILRNLRSGYDNKIIEVTGMPGSGKTIVAIYLMKRLRDHYREVNETRKKNGEKPLPELKIGFVVPQTTLRDTIKKVFSSIDNLSAADVLGPSEVTENNLEGSHVPYDILLVDEAHRLHQYKKISYLGAFKKCCEKLHLNPETSDELDWILRSCKCPILFYDKDQVVGPSGIDETRFNEKLESSGKKVVSCTLSTQMRVSGGNDYISFVKNLLQGTVREHASFDNYELKVITNFEHFDKLMREKENSDQLSRMVAGYAWEWKSKKDRSKYDIEIEGVPKRWNTELKNWVMSNHAIDEVGCIHSTQGYDLNYAFVIFGNEIGYDREKQEIIIREDNYFDKNGKDKRESIAKLKEYIFHIYYVLMTRGIKGTYLYVCDPALREYFSSVIDTE